MAKRFRITALFLLFVWEQLIQGRISFRSGYLMLLLRTLVSVYRDMHRLERIGSIARDQERGHGLRFRIGALSLHADSLSDVQTLREIHVDRVYAMDLPKGTTVIDVGMHAGFASLYFAASEEVVRVYSFEPCLPTLEDAEANFRDNLPMSAKITAHGYGLSDADRSVTWAYSHQWKGSVGHHGLSAAMALSPDTRPLTVQLRRASSIRHILEAAGGAILLKLDCEGSEDPILRDLEDEGLLARINHLCLEWHEGEVQPLLEILERNGFRILHHTDLLSANNGLLQAVRGIK